MAQNDNPSLIKNIIGADYKAFAETDSRSNAKDFVKNISEEAIVEYTGDKKDTSSLIKAIVGKLVEQQVKISYKAQYQSSDFMYWFLILAAIALFGLGIWLTIMRSPDWHNRFIIMLIIVPVSALTYLVAWGARWLRTGRIDHLFGAKKYATSGKLENIRQKIAVSIAVLNVF